MAAMIAAVLGGTGVAVAALTGPPDVEQVQARIVFERLEGTVRVCENAPGGNAVEQRVTATGRATGDPRLAGDVVLRTRLVLDVSDENLAEGYETGSLRVYERGTRRWKVWAQVNEAAIEDVNQGIAVGRVRDPDDPEATRERLFAGIRITFLPNGAIVGQLGGELPDGRLPAIVAGGTCLGESVPFETELPPPPEEPYEARRPGYGWAR